VIGPARSASTGRPSTRRDLLGQRSRPSARSGALAHKWGQSYDVVRAADPEGHALWHESWCAPHGGCARSRTRHIAPAQDVRRSAAIAIENARLLSELRQRTDDLPNRSSSRPRRDVAQAHQPIDLRSAGMLDTLPNRPRAFVRCRQRWPSSFRTGGLSESAQFGFSPESDPNMR
jgi:hypothetical protein